MMNERTENQILQEIVWRIDPQATLLRAWSLSGGLSAQMTALEIAPTPTTTRKVIVRRAGERSARLNPQAMEDEFAILQVVQHAGVKAPRPLLLDCSSALLPEPYMVLDYIEGEPEYAPADVMHAVAQMATQLARIHQVRPQAIPHAALSSLPRGAERMQARLQQQGALDESMQEGAIRAALAGFVPHAEGEAERLLHGDFWPGNLLWRDGELVAVIDWEDAALGNPLEDFAITRLDVAWFFGEAAMQHFSVAYLAAFGEGTRPHSATRPEEDTQWARDVDFQQLPYWDLLAALRPMGRIDEWAAGLAETGRADMTEAHMRAVHRRFVDQALAQVLGSSPTA
jgi:aminoglycoside phosphotransferase (APT) family kinase protein